MSSIGLGIIKDILLIYRYGVTDYKRNGSRFRLYYYCYYYYHTALDFIILKQSCKNFFITWYIWMKWTFSRHAIFFLPVVSFAVFSSIFDLFFKKHGTHGRLSRIITVCRHTQFSQHFTKRMPQALDKLKFICRYNLHFTPFSTSTKVKSIKI